MKKIVGHIEVRKNRFSKLLFLFLTVLSLLAFSITWRDPGSEKWISMVGVLLFGLGLYQSVLTRISAGEEGFYYRSMVKATFIEWKDIDEIIYDSQYHGHGVSLVLTLLYQNNRRIAIPVKQFQKESMEQFFTALYEQCEKAVMNDHFIRQATGTMTWKDKLKMY